MKIITTILGSLLFSPICLAGFGVHSGSGDFMSNTEPDWSYNVTTSFDLSSSTPTYKVEYATDDASWECTYTYNLDVDSNDDFTISSVEVKNSSQTVTHSTGSLGDGSFDLTAETFEIETNHTSHCNGGSLAKWRIEIDFVGGKLRRRGTNLKSSPTWTSFEDSED